jgi:hypothetical protein
MMVRHITTTILCLLVSQAVADSDAIRRRRRGVLEVDHKESAAEVLASLWEKDGINPDNRGLAKKGGKKGSKKGQMKGEDMSFYYF